MVLPNPLDHRESDYPVESLFLKRWSPRAMSGESIDQTRLMSLFEAARWAPSSYNEQEWHFVYANRDTEHWATLFDLLVEGNQSWCKNAATLVAVLSCKIFSKTGKPNRVHTFDAGAAFQNLALQGAAMGLVVHGMAGFNVNRARQVLRVPDEYEVEAMIAIGMPGDPDSLPAELRRQETPSSRKPVREIISEGIFR